jgi:hypothetical protein
VGIRRGCHASRPVCSGVVRPRKRR